VQAKEVQLPGRRAGTGARADRKFDA
jgi:hypothetical protein